MRATAPKRHGQSSEDYLKAIYELEEEGGAVSTNSLAEALRVSPAAVSQALRQLATKKLVKHERYYGVRLTSKGRAAAIVLIRHHRLLEVFLHDVLGYSWDEVDEEAEQLEHHISSKFVARIDRLLNFPTTDPHGEPIPSRDGKMPERSGQFLSDCEVGQTVTISWVRDIPEVLQFLDERGMRPGTMVKIVERQPLQGPLKLKVGRRNEVVGCEVAGCMFVQATARNKTPARGR